MRPRTAMEPDLIYVRRHVGVFFAVFGRINRNSGSRNLQAGIQARRVNLIGTKFSFRPLGNSHFTQHVSVVPPQLSNALEKRTVVDTAFTQSRIIILSRDLFRASSPYFRERLLPCRKDAAV